MQALSLNAYTRHLLSLSLTALVTLTYGAHAFAQDAPPEPKGIDVEVKGGAKRVLISLAIPETQHTGGASAKVAKRVEGLLRRDMELAGFFKVLPNEGLFFDPSKEGMTAADINFQNWANVNAQGLIKTRATAGAGGKISMEMRLFVVDKGSEAKLALTIPPDLSESATDALVHEFANAVVEYYTGTKGIFGSQFAFVRRNKAGLKQIWASDISGESVRSITNNSSINLLPSWGGGRLFYTSYQDQNPDLWVYEGGKNRKLSSRRGQNTGAAQCGSKLALTLSMGGENTDIYVIDPASGKQLQRLTNHWAIDTSPTWSPDCSRIAFVSGRSSSPQIYVMNADGSNQRRLTYSGTYNTTPDWSPKGDRIAFTSRDERNVFDIFTVDLDGNIERLTQNQGNNEDPSYSPDGRYLVFTSDRKSEPGIWLMTADGGYQRSILKGRGYGSPAWAR